MIRFEPVRAPDGFEASRLAGAKWLAAHPTGRPPNKWSKFASQLADGFRDLCGYSAMYDSVATRSVMCSSRAHS